MRHYSESEFAIPVDTPVDIWVELPGVWLALVKSIVLLTCCWYDIEVEQVFFPKAAVKKIAKVKLNTCRAWACKTACGVSNPCMGLPYRTHLHQRWVIMCIAMCEGATRPSTQMTNSNFIIVRRDYMRYTGEHQKARSSPIYTIKPTKVRTALKYNGRRRRAHTTMRPIT